MLYEGAHVRGDQLSGHIKSVCTRDQFLCLCKSPFNIRAVTSTEILGHGPGIVPRETKKNDRWNKLQHLLQYTIMRLKQGDKTRHPFFNRVGKLDSLVLSKVKSLRGPAAPSCEIFH